MVEAVEVGMQVQAKFSHDGQFYPALVESISKSKKRAKAPIHVKFVDSTECDEWISIADIKLPAESDVQAAYSGSARTQGRKAKAEAGRTTKARHPKAARDSMWPIGSYTISESQNMREFSYAFDVKVTIEDGGRVVWEETCGGSFWMANASSKFEGIVSVNEQGKLVFALRGHWQCIGIAGDDRGEQEFNFEGTADRGGLYVPRAPLAPPGFAGPSSLMSTDSLRLLERC